MDKNLKLKNMLGSKFHFKPHFHENLFSLKFLIGSFTTGHEIAPNIVANATKIIVLATKIQKLVAKLATRTLWVLYILP